MCAFDVVWQDHGGTAVGADNYTSDGETIQPASERARSTRCAGFRKRSRRQQRQSGRLYAGLSVEATATALRLSLNTVRTHLKQIFSKCEVQSQAELLHALALGPQSL